MENRVKKNKLIGQVAERLISTAGQEHEYKIKKKANCRHKRKAMLLKRIEEKELLAK